MNKHPRIDIIVPTYNRKNDLQRFISEINKQTYQNFYVYIIDDCSVEPLYDIIPEDKKFNYIRLNENKGQAEARNIGISAGKGQIVISMDDDAWFYNDTQALQKIQSYFANNLDLGCLMFDILEPQKKWLSDDRQLGDLQLLGSHITCGCAYSRIALEKINGFSGFFHSGAEETDLSLRLIKANFSIRFGKYIKVFHNYLPGTRSSSWYYQLRKNTTRNDLFIVILHFPGPYTFFYFLAKSISHLWYSLTHRNSILAFYASLIGISQAIIKLPRLLVKRTPLSKKQFLKWLKIRW